MTHTFNFNIKNEKCSQCGKEYKLEVQLCACCGGKGTISSKVNDRKCPKCKCKGYTFVDTNALCPECKQNK